MDPPDHRRRAVACRDDVHRQVTFLPPVRPLFAAAARALPAGLVLLALRRQLPRGDCWWKAALLGVCNIGLFFPLLFLAPTLVLVAAGLVGVRPGVTAMLS